MKKLLSFALILCMCFSLSFTLTGCGGEQNAYQEYLKSFSWDLNGEELKKETGEIRNDYVSDGYSLTGYLTLKGKGYGETFNAGMTEKESKPIIDDNDDYYCVFSYNVNYEAKTNILEVFLSSYSYNTLAVESTNGGYTWKDGFGFTYPDKGTGLALSFDMSKYFEDGTLTVEDATITSDFDMSCISTNRKGIDDPDHTYTERNSEWKTEAMERLLNSVNETLALIDAYIVANPA